MENPALLKAVLANPEDDAVRLVYADWLQEEGDGARAEFIRVQIELARRFRFDPERLPLLRRERELLERHEAEWTKPIAAISRACVFRRGFVDAVAVGGAKLLSHGRKLFDKAPVRHVKATRLGASGVTGEDIAACDFLPRIRGLELQGMLEADELNAILTAPGLEKLTSLSLECHFERDVIDLIVSGGLSNLQSLDLGEGGARFNTTDIEKLAESRWAKQLRRLSLRDHPVNVGGVEAIAASKNLKGLVYLNLNHSGAGLGGVRALAASNTLTNLETLDLRRNRLTDNAARAIAESTKLPDLKELYLGMNDLGPDGARALADWPGLSRLRLLHLYSNPIGDLGVRALARSPHAANLWRLDLSFTHFAEIGKEALAKSSSLEKVCVGSFRGDEPECVLLSPSEDGD